MPYTFVYDVFVYCAKELLLQSCTLLSTMAVYFASLIHGLS